MSLINHAQYSPTPRDMLIALKVIADLVEQSTGKTPNILVGSSKLYPPKDGQAMSKKAAVAAHEALYGEKGTVVVKDGSTPVFKQTNGAVSKDTHSLEQKVNPVQVNEAREKYQELLDSHPQTQGFSSVNYEERMSLPDLEQKMADTMVKEMAVESRLSPEEFTQVLAQGSTYVNSNLDNKVGDDLQISEGLGYLADADSSYREWIGRESVTLENIAASQATEPEALVPELGTAIDIEALPVIEEPSHILSDNDFNEIFSESTRETKDPLINLEQVSENLTPDKRFAPGSTPSSEALETTIAELTGKIEALQTEMKSMQKTMEKIANKEPIPKIRSWAKNKVDGVISKMQDRAKVDMVKTVNFGKNLAQKAMDRIAQTAGVVETSTLKVDGIKSDLKAMFNIHDNAPEVTSGDYTFKNDNGNISVNHKDRGEVFAIGDNVASFKGKFNADDYRMLSSVKEAVAVIAGPAAIAAEVVKDLAVSAVKGAVSESAQKSAVKL